VQFAFGGDFGLRIFGSGKGGFGIARSGIVICAGCKYSPHPGFGPRSSGGDRCAARTDTFVREIASGNEHGHYNMDVNT